MIHTSTARSSKPFAARLRPQLFLWALWDIYGAGLWTYFALKWIAGDGFWPVALANNLIQWMLLPAFAALLLAIWRKRRRMLILYAPLVAAFGWLFGELFLPPLSPPAVCATVSERCTTRLRVMAFNLENASTNMDRLVAYLRSSGADIVALEEVGQGQPETLAGQVADIYPYRVLYGEGIPGIGLLSKYPIVSHQRLTTSASFLFNLQVVLDVDGTPLTVIVAHPGPPGYERTSYGIRYVVRNHADIEALAALASGGQATLLLGDFNMVDQSAEYRMLVDAGLRDAFREAGWGFGSTWPADGFFTHVPSMVRIDYVFYSADFEATAAWVGPSSGGDHQPVLADLVWQK